MKPYASIETVFTRGPVSHRLDFGVLRAPETALVNSWTVSEKIDGTNIRVIVTLDGIEVKGRTDAAVLPPGLEAAVLLAMPYHAQIVRYFTEYRGRQLHENWSVTFYGEGYGAGIQKGGLYSETKRFRVFDLLLGESWWTDDGEMRSVCRRLGIPVVPFLGYHYGPAPQSESGLKSFFPRGSETAGEDRGVFGVAPEGIVAKPTVVLLDKHGNRVMWKLTFREFAPPARDGLVTADKQAQLLRAHQLNVVA